MPIDLNSVLNSCRTLQANASVCDTFLRLADFQNLGANRVKPCFYLLGPTQKHSISLRHFLDIHRLPVFRCQYSLTCFTTYAECSNETLILTYTHIYILTCRQTDRQTYMNACIHTYIHTVSQTDGQTDRQTDMVVCTHVSTHASTHTCKHTNIEVRSKKLEVRS